MAWVRVGSVAALLVVLGQRALDAQTLQLPTLRFFSVQTSVLAPDRGGAMLGGVTRSQSRSQAAGVPGVAGLPGLGRLTRNRGIDRVDAAGTVSVHATVIDHAVLDQAVLAEAARRRAGGSRVPAVGSLSARYRQAAERTSAQGVLRSVAEIRREQTARRP
ncbi:MAG: type II and III secretion system protein [Pirellulaceae bacterium]|nr:type II and III secretion system protein [Pirellulaceae bacterium]